MGIVNVTPDSFSGDGVFKDVTLLDEKVQAHVNNGAHYIDIGGQSSRPGAELISESEEYDRVIPAIKYIKNKWPNQKISVDTSSPAIMKKAIAEGVHMINDINAFQTPGALDAIEGSNVEVIIMHMQGNPQNMQNNPQYGNVIEEITQFFRERKGALESTGVPEKNIWLDPGFGFGKSMSHNYQILSRLKLLQKLSKNICVGMSRKSMIGSALGDSNRPREFGTVGAHLLAALQGAGLHRVHEVGALRDVFKVLECLEAEMSPHSLHLESVIGME
tara:strand:- start:5864 stop:6688 length:825 start_codon:yes stop_codon:yes gene_type:complete